MAAKETVEPALRGKVCQWLKSARCVISFKWRGGTNLNRSVKEMGTWTGAIKYSDRKLFVLVSVWVSSTE